MQQLNTVNLVDIVDNLDKIIEASCRFVKLASMLFATAMLSNDGADRRLVMHLHIEKVLLDSTESVAIIAGRA
jgi:hypothetical protein